MRIGGIGAVLPDITHIKEALAAGRALEQARYALAPVGIPEDPPAADIVGARTAFREAIDRLHAVLAHAAGRPGTNHVELALEEAEEALVHLTAPGITPPIADVMDHAVRGEELVQEAVKLFDRNPAGWVGPAALA